MHAHLGDVGAFRKYPGLTTPVTVTATTVEVRLTAPVDLPLAVPGSPDRPRSARPGQRSSVRSDSGRHRFCHTLLSA